MTKARISGHLLLLISLPLLGGGACEKKSAKAGDTGAITALDRAGSSTEQSGPVDTTPLPGIDATKLDKDHQQLFYKLLGSLSSPCGKAHSLRTSFTSDTSCKRAPFAVRYLLALTGEEIEESEIREFYDKKYKPADKAVKIDASKAPHAGAEDAQVRFYEFYDYGCPHCKMFKPIMEQVLADEQGKVAMYFMQFPLKSHVDSPSAAQAALAAAKQGKFKEMNDLLFEKAPLHDHEHVTEYAKQIGLDLAKFEADYTAAAAQVASDLSQGDAANVDSTPTVFFNDRKYDGPMMAKYIEMWIDEEIAVNR